jgi:hypothetical protein
VGRPKKKTGKEAILANCVKVMEEGMNGTGSRTKEEIASAIQVYKTLSNEDMERGANTPVLRVSDRVADALTEFRKLLEVGVPQGLVVLEATSSTEH